ncbi:hypothetical protein [Arthrobacter sp. ISL-30]|uniref:hypothetical protein n=1 Tax=Arthrobacter sp. ISL-30 TaxID=2819109 RepID=UPI001BE73190|nr:hypothetical protein [Arthrobacter sp. ISL-30]MBT2513400.1 hypothetical protein [Arthrobacter sp. ISL-30]
MSNTAPDSGSGPDEPEPVGRSEMPAWQPNIAPLPESTTLERTTAAGRQIRSRQGLLKRVPFWGRLVVPAVLVAGLIAGAVLGLAARPAVSSTKEYAALSGELTGKIKDAETTISQLRSAGSDKDAQIKTLQSAADGVKTLEQQLAEKEKALAGKEADLASREQKFSEAQKQVAANQIKNGLHVVGGDVQPGVYTTAGPDGTNSVGCYYAWMTSTGSDADIKDNNIVRGVATVTLVNGEVFESSSCQPWSKIG